MMRSSERIRTTHTGSMPRPPEILETVRQIEAGQPYDAAAYEPALAAHVAASVRMQVAAGIDVVNDGECSKAGNTEIPIGIAWAKLQALGAGARLASTRLWN